MRRSPATATPIGEHGQKSGLGQRRHRLDLGVAERMIVVGGLVGLAHGEKGQPARADVERVVRASESSASEPDGKPAANLTSARVKLVATEASAARVFRRESAFWPDRRHRSPMQDVR